MEVRAIETFSRYLNWESRADPAASNDNLIGSEREAGR
jgi:hypothetical protein